MGAMAGAEARRNPVEVKTIAKPEYKRIRRTYLGRRSREYAVGSAVA